MELLRIILFPFGLAYGLVMYIRNKLYDWSLISSRSFPIPVVGVGNLSVGGTGKTPHVEYLVRLLQGEFRVAVLSRGYKRKTQGFILAAQDSSSDEIGDEPFQLKSKFKNLCVAVDEDRVRGIDTLLAGEYPPQVILLDDAYQHRAVKAGISILLTDFYNLYSDDFVLPAGRLREFRSGARRADIIVVTKSPVVLSPFVIRDLRRKLKLSPHQHLFFSYLRHGRLKPIPGVEFIPETRDHYAAALLVAGIANPYPLELFLKEKIAKVETFLFRDHHQFTTEDVDRITERFDRILTKNKIIVTTEKDKMRLIHPELIRKIRTLPICYVPIEVKFHKQDQENYDNHVRQFISKFTKDNKLYPGKDPV